ncbi:unnamed protein product, partial [Owenia fusiformis]
MLGTFFGKMYLGVHAVVLLLCLQGILADVPPVDPIFLDVQVVCPMIVVECEDECVKTTDAEGCDVCICPEPEIACAVPRCINDCGLFGGFKINDLGCQTCDCNEPMCPQVDCPPWSNCEKRGGYGKDARGCQSCECDCPPCSTGFKTDANGCMTCDCDVPACPMFRCPNDCPNGYKKNSDGCMSPTCECNPS